MSEPPIVPDDASDETDDRGWGERLIEDESDADLRRFLEDRPPHHEER